MKCAIQALRSTSMRSKTVTIECSIDYRFLQAVTKRPRVLPRAVPKRLGCFKVGAKAVFSVLGPKSTQISVGFRS